MIVSIYLDNLQIYDKNPIHAIIGSELLFIIFVEILPKC